LSGSSRPFSLTTMPTVKAGGARNRPISDKISANICRDTPFSDPVISSDRERQPNPSGAELMYSTDRRERFRAILSGNRCVHPASVYDAISARIAEDLGFEVGMFSGSIGSMSVLGAPDLVVLTLTEFAGQAYRICRAGNLALLVDADHGYGNALNVAPHGRGAGDGRHLCIVDRGYGAAAALWIRRQTKLELGRRGDRQNGGGRRRRRERNYSPA
jgi:hypothetical protein